MSFIRILENDDFIVDYDKERGMYRVGYFEDSHFKDEILFNEYKETEENCDHDWTVTYADFENKIDYMKCVKCGALKAHMY